MTQKRSFKKTSIDVEMHLYLMAVSENINLTAFTNRCLALFFEVPEDPRHKLIKEKSEYAVLRLRQKYEKEVSDVINEYAEENKIDELAKVKEAELREFGEYLQRTSAYPVFRKCLMKRDPDDDTLSIVTREVNKMNGRKYDETELWNQAVTWFRKYGDAINKKVPV